MTGTASLCLLLLLLFFHANAAAQIPTDTHRHTRLFEVHDGRSWNHSLSTMTPCVVIRTHSTQQNAVLTQMLSFCASGHPLLQAFVVNTGSKPMKNLRRLVAQVNELCGRKWVTLADHSAQLASNLFPSVSNKDYGLTITDLMLEEILADKKSRQPKWGCDVMLITNGDNVYSHNFLPATMAEIASGADIAATHWTTHHQFDDPTRALKGYWDLMGPYGRQCGHLREGRDAEVVTSDQLLVGCVDMGAVLFRLSVLDTSGLRLIIDKLRLDPTGASLIGTVLNRSDGTYAVKSMEEYFFSADGYFANRYAALPGVKTAVIRRALYYHQ